MKSDLARFYPRYDGTLSLDEIFDIEIIDDDEIEEVVAEEHDTPSRNSAKPQA